MIQTGDARESEQSRLIQYLDDFGKQISSRRQGTGLEEQLASLSRNYNLAQQKLLETERALMSETIVVEKQRSVIELYKYIMGQDLDDEGTLSFLQHLEEEESNSEIYQELTELKSLLGRKKVRQCRREMQEERSVRDLKKEVERLQEENRNTDEESLVVNGEINELREQLNRSNLENKNLKLELSKIRQEMGCLEDNLHKIEEQLGKQKRQRTMRDGQCESLAREVARLKEVQRQSVELLTLLQSKLNWQSHPNKENNNLQPRSKDIIALTGEKLTQLMKYRQSYKKVKENLRDFEQFKREISLLKLFLSQQALSLVKQFQTQPMDCLETELRNLAAMQKNNLLKLQDSQREVWKYRLQLMKEEEMSANSHCQTLPLFRSRQPTDSNTSNIVNAQLVLSVQNPHCVSQFTSEPASSPEQ